MVLLLLVLLLLILVDMVMCSSKRNFNKRCNEFTEHVIKPYPRSTKGSEHFFIDVTDICDE